MPVPDLAVAHCYPGKVIIYVARATMKRIVPNAGNTVRYDDGCKAAAPGKRRAPNAGNTVRYDDRSKADARLKRTAPNAGDTVSNHD